MALTRTSRLAANSAAGFGTGAYTPSAFTPSDNSLLVVIGWGINQSSGTMNGSAFTLDNSAGLTFTPRVNTVQPPDWGYGIRIWTAPVVTGVSMTVSIDAGANDIHGYRLEAYDYTSGVGTVGVGATAEGSDADGDGPLTITLTGAPATASEVLAALAVGMANGTHTCTPGSGWNELTDTAFVDWLGMQIQARTGSTDTAVDWVDILTGGTTNGGAVACALEITETVEGGGEPPGFGFSSGFLKRRSYRPRPFAPGNAR